MVAHIRRSLQFAFPTTWRQEPQKPFGEQWKGMVESSERARASGTVDAVAKDDFDYLGVERFFNLVEIHYPVLFPEDWALPEVERAQPRSSTLVRIKLVKDVRDPMSHTVDDDFSFMDAISLLDAARKVLRNVDPSASARIKELADHITAQERGSPAPESDERGPLERSLPARESIAPNFVGRKAELAALRQWMLDPASRRWALAGEGGKGKTALAYAFALVARQEAPSPLELLIWLSAKRRQFLEGQVREIARPDFTDLRSALDCVLVAYGRDDALDWEPEVKHQGRDHASRPEAVPCERTLRDRVGHGRFTAPYQGSSSALCDRGFSSRRCSEVAVFVGRRC
jgi:hypothetical protein